MTVTKVFRENDFGNQEGFNSPIAAGPAGVWITSDDLASASVQQVDPTSGEPVRTVDLGIDPGDMSRLAVGNAAIWHANRADGSRQVTVSRIDGRSGKVVGAFQVAFETVSAVSSPGDDLWIFGAASDGQYTPMLAKLDPATGKVLEQYPTGEGLSSAKRLAFTPTQIWLSGLADDGQGGLVWIDRTTNEVHAIDLGEGRPNGMAVVDGAVWALGFKGGNESDLVKLSPDGQVQDRLPIDLTYVEDLQADGGSVWLLGGDGEGRVVERRDPETGKVVATTCSSAESHNFAVSDDVAWIPGPSELARVELSEGS